MRFIVGSSLLVWLLCADMSTVASHSDGLQVSPQFVVLDGPEASQQLLVNQRDASNAQEDLTHRSMYHVSNPEVVRVDNSGLIEPVGEGKTEVVVHHAGKQVHVEVEVKGLNHPVPVAFDQQILPLLTKAGCNSGACHGKAEGQNGFKLSVFGFDAESDYQAVVFESRGRRVFPASPLNSLFLAKASGRIAHGGGKKISEGTPSYHRLARWLTEGMHFRNGHTSQVIAIEVEPKEINLALQATQQVRVSAIDDQGKRRCVTIEAEYESNMPSLAAVNNRGRIQGGSNPGEAAILVRYLGQVTYCRVTLPRPGVRFVRPPEANFVDTLVWNKLEQLGIPPSQLADDATFLRRVFLDTIGTLPSSTEARTFLANADPLKRAKLIDHLLERPEYADYWTMKWADLLRVDRDTLTAAGAVAMTRWLRQQFAENRPYDQFVREIVTSKGSTTARGPVGFFKALDKPEVMSRSISQLFLGVRIECAQCHHHPSEKWGQEDYYALAGFFTGITRKPIPGGELIEAGPGSDMKHPRTEKMIPARALGAAPPALPMEPDGRRSLAQWMTSTENPFFAKSIANRLWAHYYGRGLIEPIDDLRVTNPASNEPLLNELAKHLKANKYDLKAFTRTLLNSRVYQTGAQLATNVSDEQNFSHSRPRTLPAEVLLDAISQSTGVPEKFDGWPLGIRAINVWDNRMPSYFLKLFGRPDRISVCECERSSEPSIAQALHLMNSPEIAAKIHARTGTARRLSDSDKTPEAVIEELYLSVLSRYPTKAEQHVMLELFSGAGSDRRNAVEDVLWTLLNTKEFIYNH